jgi:hypothetical protein
MQEGKEEGTFERERMLSKLTETILQSVVFSQMATEL